MAYRQYVTSGALKTVRQEDYFLASVDPRRTFYIALLSKFIVNKNNSYSQTNINIIVNQNYCSDSYVS